MLAHSFSSISKSPWEKSIMGSDLALDRYKVNNTLKSSAPLLPVSEPPLCTLQDIF